MDTAPKARLRRFLDLFGTAAIASLLFLGVFLLAQRAGFTASYPSASYESARAQQLGSSNVRSVSTASVGGQPARWVAHDLPDGRTGLELVVETGGETSIVGEGDAADEYSGPVRSAILPGADAFDLSPPGRPLWIVIPLAAFVAGLAAFGMIRQPGLGAAIGTRLSIGLLSLLFISFVVFVADEVAPGDAALVRLGEKNVTVEKYEAMRHEMGLDRPWPIRYGEFLFKAAKLDFGESYYGTHEPVVKTLKRDLPMTMRTALSAILLAAVIGILLGVIASVHRNRAADRTVLIVSTLGVTLPAFVLAPFLQYIFAVQLDRLPLTWVVDRTASDWLYLILPVAVLAARPMALLTRLTRASMIDTFQQEFIRTAIAKGVPPMRLIFRHALRNAILPVITAVGTSFGFLLTGSFVVERAFTMPGLGSETIEAIQRGDTPLIQACILLTGALFIFVNLLVDLILPLLDPRIREAQV